MSTIELPSVWTVAQAVEKIDHAYSEATLRREIKAGRLRARRVGRTLRILDEELARWMRDYESQPISPTDRASVRGPATPQRLGDDTPGSVTSRHGDVEPGVDRQDNQGGK